MEFWDVARKIAKATLNAACKCAARECDRMKNPCYRESKMSNV